MADMTSPPEGLRARKRAATQAAIEKVAVELALEHGYAHVTVDMVCEASMISQRTFFNYFGSKEGVILGPDPVVVTPVAAEGFVASTGNDILLDLVHAIARSVGANLGDRAMMKARFAIITATPELLAKQMEWMSAGESRLVELVLERFAARGRTEAGEPELFDEAAIVVGLALTVLRFTLQKQFADGGDLPDDDALAHATRLIERVVGRR